MVPVKDQEFQGVKWKKVNGQLFSDLVLIFLGCYTDNHGNYLKSVVIKAL